MFPPVDFDAWRAKHPTRRDLEIAKQPLAPPAFGLRWFRGPSHDVGRK
jgi:hypothetical protein